MLLANNKKQFWLISIFLILIIAILLFSFGLAGFNITSPDSPGLWCGAKSLIETGEFSDGSATTVGFSSCWPASVYPAYQLLVATLAWPFSSNSIGLIIVLTSILVAAINIFLITDIARLIWQNKYITTTTLILSATSLSLAYALVLTPHNLFGYCFLLLGFRQLVRYLQTDKIICLFFACLIAVPLYFFHQLSFFVYVISSMLFFLSAPKNIFIKISGGLVGIIGLVFLSGFYFQQWNIFKFLNSFNPPDPQNLEIHPIFDHPAVLGYFLVLFGVAGFILLWRSQKNKKIPLLLLSFIVAPFVFTLTPYFWMQMVPFRFLFFLWIPLTLLASYGFYHFARFIQTHLPQWNMTILFIVLFLAGGAHVLVFDYHNFKAYTKPYLLDSETKDAFKYLQAHTAKQDHILALYYNYHNPAISIPSFSSADIKVYVQNLKTAKKFTKIFQNPQRAETKFYQEIESIKNKNQAQAFLDKYQINWLIFWPENMDANFVPYLIPVNKPVFENKKIIIYDLKP